MLAYPLKRRCGLHNFLYTFLIVKITFWGQSKETFWVNIDWKFFHVFEGLFMQKLLKIINID